MTGKTTCQNCFSRLQTIPNIHILANNVRDRLGIISFYIHPIHYNLIVKLLSDRFGIQVRGGCVCAGTYGHYLLNVDYSKSKTITDKINHGDLSEKPGWVRLSLHPTTTEEELHYIINSLRQIERYHTLWVKDYFYDKHTNEFTHRSEMPEKSLVRKWFHLD